MRNEILWGIMLLVNFFSIIFIYKKFGKLGLFMWVPISSILANIQVVLLVNLFGFETTLGNIMYAGGFLVTDILSENYGEDEAKTAVKLGFFSMIVTAIIMKIAVSFVPSAVQEGVANFQSLKMIFDFMPRILFAGLVAYGISQRHDVWAYKFWKNRFPSKKHIWIRNNFSTLISQLIDNLIFTTIAFAGVYPMQVLVEIFIVTYVMKVIVATLDTPFVYLASYLKENKKVSENILI
ncbi:queuosine precursor transporter [uncultured Cetobacterium sp.]|uniref:queuosine precursor transporter n=1 Tax=uncultured Cetobacterium sp. TaxID=527638 RepID=UPI00263659E2|nr:queuosine precursor transporter [uncultured Cetobacterium sp.]